MKLRVLFAVLVTLTLGCSAFRCDGQSRPTEIKENRPAPDLRLVLLTDPKGYLEPCGCQLRPLGGLDRLATVVGKLRAEAPPVVLLAAGDLTFGGALNPEDAEGAKHQELLRAQTLVDIWNQLLVLGVTPGSADLGQPPEVLSELMKRSSFPWIVDNIEDSGNGPALPVSGARVINAGSFKIGVMGIVMPSPDRALSGRQALTADVATIAKQTATALRDQGAQLVVALLTGDRRAAKEVASQGVDVVVLGGIDQEKPLAPVVVGDGLVVNAGYQGQRIVTLDLKLHAQGAWHDASEWTLREARADLEQRVRELRSKVDAWSQDKSVRASELDAQRARLEQLKAELATQAQPSFTGRWFSAEITELAPEVPKHAETQARLKAYDRHVNEYNRVSLTHLKPAPAAEGAAHYAGTESCKGCHSEAYAWWKNTKHGRAYKTLEDLDKQYNLSCVGCHVTGYNKPGGSTVTHVDLLKDVGCESCHGPGSQHTAAPTQPGLVARDTPEAICVSCHNHEHSDRFVYDAFKSMLIVPGHGLPAKPAP